MSKFNQTRRDTTVNKSGHAAYAMKNKDKLVTQVLTSFFGEAKFYGDNTNEMVELAERIAVTNPRFISNLARYTRKELHLRSVAHALTCIVAHTVESKPYIKDTVEDVVERADDLTEILACYIGMYGKPIPNGLKKAISSSLKRFNAFQVSKYNGGNKSVTFKDILRITHVKPDNEYQDKMFNDILNDTLPVAKRWETELSAKGNTKETWEELIENNRVGYMAALRNLRNMIQAKPDNIQKVYDKLSNRQQVLDSKQLPFRFLSAYKNVAPYATSKTLDVLEDAAEYSMENLPKIKGRTIIAIDVSGSMSQCISLKSDISCGEIASLLGIMASKLCEEYEIYTFDTRIRKQSFSSRSGIIESAIRASHTGGGTNLKLPLELMINNEISADRLIILSDNEINMGYKYRCQALADEYRREINPDLWIHAIDMQGYGTQQFIGGKTNIIAGWSEKILEFINLVEQGIETQVNRIEQYHESTN